MAHCILLLIEQNFASSRDIFTYPSSLLRVARTHTSENTILQHYKHRYMEKSYYLLAQPNSILKKLFQHDVAKLVSSGSNPSGDTKFAFSVFIGGEI